MKVLVTGHKGFIGSHVYEALKKNHEVVGLDYPDDIGSWDKYWWVYQPKFDIVIHLAAFAALRKSISNPDVFWENNVVKSKPIFDYCEDNNIRCLYASSAGVYEWWRNPYVMTKKVNELQAPKNSVGMRFFNVWAEEDSRPDMLYRMLLEGKAKYLTRHERDWVHVDDVVSAIEILMHSDYTGTVDVGTGETTSVLDLAKFLGVEGLPIKEDTPNEPDVLKANPVVLRDLGWIPTPFMDKLQSKCYTK